MMLELLKLEEAGAWMAPLATAIASALLRALVLRVLAALLALMSLVLIVLVLLVLLALAGLTLVVLIYLSLIGVFLLLRVRLVLGSHCENSLDSFCDAYRRK